MENMSILSTKPYARPYTLATEVGQKIIVTKGVHGYHKPEKFRGLYNEGDILTVKKFSHSRWEYGTEFHILEVEELSSPEGISALILPGEYKVVKKCYTCDPREKDDYGDRHGFLLDTFFCTGCNQLWQD